MRFLRFFARSQIGSRLIGWMLTHMSSVLRVNRLHETDTLLAFQHPEPAYPVHILLVPKKAIGSLMDLGEADHVLLQDVFKTAQLLVVKLALDGTGYRLILNGGDYQDIPHLHFHLVSGDPHHNE